MAAAALTAVSSAATLHRAPALRRSPSISGKTDVGNSLVAHPGRWARASGVAFRWERCNHKAGACKLIRLSNGSGRTYRLTTADKGHRIRVVVTARNRWGRSTATSRATAVIAAAGAPGSSSPTPGRGGTGPGGTGPGSTGPGGTGSGGTSVNYFATVPSSETGSPPAGIPRPDATCAAAVDPEPEVRPQNATANNTVPPSSSSVDWGTALNYWTTFVNDDRGKVTGDYTGTTDEILQWVSCKWGIDVNVVRADAWQESSWIQSTVGDTCSPSVDDEGSFGILQVRNKICSGAWVHGGWPYTQDDTALDADYWGARLRGCFDGAFYNGGSWLYNGQTIAQVIAAHGEDYALWGCIGSWFSGQWYDSGAQSYIAKVQSLYTSQPWRSLGAQ